MASPKGASTRLLRKQRSSLVRDLDVSLILPRLVKRGIFSASEQIEILSRGDSRVQTEIFLDFLERKDAIAFREFCASLEDCHPELLTRFLLDNAESPNDDQTPTKALQLGFELALKERDEVLREKSRAIEERDQALRQIQLMREERDKAVTSLENLTTIGRSGKNNSKNNIDSATASPLESRTRSPNRKSKEKLHKMESDGEVEEVGDNVTWETRKVLLAREPGFGFGIAISGGRDNPHFANGDPSIAISDVLKAGPAEGKLQINDRVASVNGISLDNVDHATAIAVMKGCDQAINLVIRRRIILSSSADDETSPLKVSLNKKHRKDEYGVVLGCKYFIKEIRGNSLAAQEGGLKEGDSVLKINNIPVETMSLVEARKHLEKAKDKLYLVITKKKQDLNHKRQNSNIKEDELALSYGAAKRPIDTHNVNIYHPLPRADSLYKGSSVQALGPVPNIPSERQYHDYQPASDFGNYEAQYSFDQDAPPRPPLPSGVGSDAPLTVPTSPPSDRRDGYFSDKEDPYNRRRSDQYTRHSEKPRESRDRSESNDYIDGLDQRQHQERYIEKRSDIRSGRRFVQFKKDEETGLGLRLAGGNATGIFIASVQADSAAEVEGLVEGDQILKANDRDITGLTREEAVVYLTSLKGLVSLVVDYQKEEYDVIMASREAGDSFYIRTHFNYVCDESEQGELSFKIGEVFHIKDTLYRGVVGSWIALRIDRNTQEFQKGIIPNQNRAEILAASQLQVNENKENTPTRSRGSLFRRKSGARRAKSLGRDHWEDVIFSDSNASLKTKFPAYERVLQKNPGFVRPVVIFGSLSNVARSRLLNDRKDLFESAQEEGRFEDTLKGGNSGIMKLGSLRNIISKDKHCLLDVTPHAVDRLNYAQYYPITIFLKAETKQNVKDLRTKWLKSSTKNPKKLFEQSQKLEKMYSHLFTGTISHHSTDSWYHRLLELIELQQNNQIWMSENKPEEDISDDVLFPMTSRLSFVASPESELDLSRAHESDTLPRTHGHKLLVRSSSDPSVATGDKIPGIPPYPSPPNYQNGAREKSPPIQNYIPGIIPNGDQFGGRPEDRYYPSYYADSSHGNDDPNYVAYPHARANIDPYATLTPSERIRGKVSDDLFSHQDGRQFNPAYADYRDPYRERVNSDGFPPPKGRVPPTGEASILRVNVDAPHPKMHNDSSSYSSDSYSRHTARPDNKHDDSKLREKFADYNGPSRGDKSVSHNPYRFTRSTANPVNVAQVDKAKLSDLSAKFRRDDQNLRPRVSPNKPQSSQHAPLKPVNEVEPPVRRKEPPPVPPKNYSLADRGFNREEYKMRNYENSYRHPQMEGRHPRYPSNQEPYQYTNGDIERPEHSITRSTSVTMNGPRDYNHAPVERQTSDGYTGRYRSNGELERMDTYGAANFPDRYSRENVYDKPPPPRTYSNKAYMSPTGSDKNIAVPEHGYVTDGKYLAQDSGYPSPNDRPRDGENKNAPSKVERKDSNFDSYRKLITPGFYATRPPFAETTPNNEYWDMGQALIAKDRTVLQNATPLREPQQIPIENGTLLQAPHREDLRDPEGSAFESYNRASGEFSTFGKTSPSKNSVSKADSEVNGVSSTHLAGTLVLSPLSMDQLERLTGVTADPPLIYRTKPPVDLLSHVTPSIQSESSRSAGKTDLNSDRSVEQDTDGATSESVSTPETVVHVDGFDDAPPDENHTVVATARGVFDHTGGILESPQTGVSIVIPPGAIAEGVQQELYFKVCKDSSILPPLDKDKGETLLSPLVMCGPHGLKFSKAVELRLPHCASVNPESWSFALKSSDSPTGHPTHWQNMALAGLDGAVAQGKVSKNSVSVLVDHF